MAYGQTSSGKTFTLVGTDEQPGIIPRYIEDLFCMTNSLPANFKIQCGFFEIYNEAIYDLLDVKEFHQTGKANLSLREDPKKGVFVDGLTQESVTNVGEAIAVFKRGDQFRRTAETKMNERSSRSHAIFCVSVEHDFIPDVEIVQEEVYDASTIGIKLKKRAVINFVDLAGSERQFGTDIDRLKETCQINKSLVVLSSVINNMGDGGKKFMHVRDSK